jgi:hypothetical protein
MKCILIIGKKNKNKKNEFKQKNEKKNKILATLPMEVPLVTLHMCNVTNGTSIGNVAHLQRY